jgi:antitoxin (DNA-binding transcriptional repressor) of toxin-antitoxin stability system
VRACLRFPGNRKDQLYRAPGRARSVNRPGNEILQGSRLAGERPEVGARASLIDMAIQHGHVESMKVKTAEFKNNLSRYLRHVRERGMTIIVCDRDRPIAALSPLPVGEAEDPQWTKECAELRGRFEEVGLACRPPLRAAAGLPNIKPSKAPDGRPDISTVEEMRRARDW